MKKLLLFLPIILILTACGAKPASIQKNFKAEASCVYNDIKIKADVISENHIITIIMKKPDNLKGYTFRYKGSKLTVTYKNLKLKAEKDYLPASAFPSIINNVLDAVNHDGINYSGSYKNKAEYKGKSESGEFIFTSDYNTGFIKNIKLRKLGFSADFK